MSIKLRVIVVSADAQLTQGGWCVRFDTPGPIVRDSTGRPHSWDVRADWRSPEPACSAVMTSGYRTFRRFPVWFFNLPPADNNLPLPDDRPPYATTQMTVLGFIDDRNSLPARWRFLGHLAAAVWVLWWMGRVPLVP